MCGDFCKDLRVLHVDVMPLLFWGVCWTSNSDVKAEISRCSPSLCEDTNSKWLCSVMNNKEGPPKKSVAFRLVDVMLQLFGGVC